ncbi:hypothetical protein FRC20_002965 [Serendipita sp. 405]|nr:hypothetical protein FRC20_002965 [Serendipita sp. 405]
MADADPTAGDPSIASKAEAHQSTPPASANFPAFGIPRVNSSPARSGPTMHTPPTAYLRSDGGRVKFISRGGHTLAGYLRDDEEGSEQLFDELIRPDAISAGMRPIGGMSNGLKSSPSSIPESWTVPEPLNRPPVKNMKLPAPTKRSYRSSLYDIARQYVSVATPEGYTPSDPPKSPSPPPPEIQHRSSPPLTPDDPTLMAVQFDPMELPPERRNPNGINWIVQSPEHGYLLMRHLEKQQRSLNQRQSLHQAPLPAGEGSAVESGDTPSGELALSQQGNAPQQRPTAAPNVPRNLATTGPSGTPPDGSPNRWHSVAQDPSGTWSAQQSPVRSSVPQGWQMNPQSYGQQSAGMIPPAGPRPYQTPEGWTQPHPSGYAVHQPPPSPLSPAQWQPGNGQPQQQQQQQQPPHPAPTGAVAPGPPPREGSWIPGERRPPSAAASRWPTQSTPVPHGAPSQQWTPSMSNPPSSAVWQEHGHQPHPTIDGRADSAMRWVEGVPNPTVTWGAPGSNVVPMGEGGESAPPTGYSIADAGRTINTRVRDGEGSAQPSPVTWSAPQSSNPPWASEGRNPTVLPPDGRIQTPGGTGAMGGVVHSAPTPSSVHPPPTPTSHAPAPSYGPSTVFHPSYPSQVGPPPPGSMTGREMQPGSQPDSLGTYAQPSMGPPPPSSMGPGPRPGGYTIHGMSSTPMEAGNPYPQVPPPAPGTAPYRTAVPRPNMGIGMPPGADANQNFYPSFHNQHNPASSQQATPMTIDHAPPNSFGGYAHMNASQMTYPMVPNQQGPPNPQARRPPTMGMNPYPNVGNQGIPQNPQDMYGPVMGMPYGAPPPPPQ